MANSGGRPKTVTEERVPLNAQISIELSTSAHSLLGLFGGTMQELVSTALQNEIDRRLDSPRAREAHSFAFEQRMKKI